MNYLLLLFFTMVVGPGLSRLYGGMNQWTAVCFMLSYFVVFFATMFPVSGYNGNDTTEPGDMNGE